MHVPYINEIPTEAWLISKTGLKPQEFLLSTTSSSTLHLKNEEEVNCKHKDCKDGNRE